MLLNHGGRGRRILGRGAHRLGTLLGIADIQASNAAPAVPRATCATERRNWHPEGQPGGFRAVRRGEAGLAERLAEDGSSKRVGKAASPVRQDHLPAEDCYEPPGWKCTCDFVQVGPSVMPVRAPSVSVGWTTLMNWPVRVSCWPHAAGPHAAAVRRSILGPLGESKALYPPAPTALPRQRPFGGLAGPSAVGASRFE
jgi:hypothetical protein